MLAALFFGICARLGALVGFILSIRCAIWILTPESIPGSLKALLPGDPNMVFLALVAVPGAAFLGLAVAQVLHSNVVLKLRNAVSERLAAQFSELRLHETGEEQLKDRPTMSQMAADIRVTHGEIVTVEAMLINLLVTTFGLCIAFTGGMIIDWVLMGIIALVGVSFSVSMAIYQYTKSHAMAQEQENVRRQEKHEIEDFVNLSRSADPDLKILEEAQQRTPQMLQAMSHQKSADHKFTRQSTLFVDLGQTALIVTFMLLLIDYSGTAPERISMLIILTLIFRFLSSYLQVITHLVIKLGMHYRFVSDLRNRLQGKQFCTS